MSSTSKRIFAIGRIPQVDYNTPLVPTSSPKNYEQVVKEGYDFAAPTVTLATNEGFSTGTPNATISEIDRHDVTVSLNERMTSQRLGRRATAAFGLPTTTFPSGVTAGAWKHVFKPLDPTIEAELPAYTYIEKAGEPANSGDITDDRAYPSMMVERFGIESGTGSAYLMGSTDWRGSGKVVEPSGVAFTGGTTHVLLDENAAENSIKAGQAVVNIYPQVNLGGSAMQVLCDFRSVRMNYTTNLVTDAGYLGCGKYQIANDATSGNVRGSMPAGNPGIELSFTLIKSINFAQNFNPLAKMRAQTQFSIAFVYSGAAISGVTGTAQTHKATWKYTKLTVSSVTQGDESGRETYDITCFPMSLGSNYPFELELINNVQSYASV